MKTRLYCLICMFVACGAYADSTPTSKNYVDSVLAQKEGIMNAKSVDTLVTYPKTGGDAVERPIKSSITDTSTTDASVVTAGAANTKIETKQDKVLNLPTENVLLYSDTDGTIASRQIYNSNNQMSDGLVTAQTLNDAVVAAVNSELEPVEGIGWRIIPNGVDRPLTLYQTTNLITFGRISGKGGLMSGKDGTYTIVVGGFDTGHIGGSSIRNGAVKVVTNGNNGCSTQPPTLNRKGYIMDNSVVNTALGTYCYCPMFMTYVRNSDTNTWAYLGEVPLNRDKCDCEAACADEINNNPVFRAIVFGN